MKLFRKIKKGFTLVELVVVIAVIAILAAVSVGAYFGVTESAKASQLQQEAKQLYDVVLIVGNSNSNNHQIDADGLHVVDTEVFEDAINEVTGGHYEVYEEDATTIAGDAIILKTGNTLNLTDAKTYKSFEYYTPETGKKAGVIDIVSGEYSTATNNDIEVVSLLYTQEEVYKAIEKASTDKSKPTLIKLGASIIFDDNLLVDGEKAIILDLNRYTMSAKDVGGENSNNANDIFVLRTKDKANVIVTGNGIMHFSSDTRGAAAVVGAYDNSEVTIKNGHFSPNPIDGGTVLYSKGDAKIYIEGGHFDPIVPYEGEGQYANINRYFLFNKTCTTDTCTTLTEDGGWGSTHRDNCEVKHFIISGGTFYRTNEGLSEDSKYVNGCAHNFLAPGYIAEPTTIGGIDAWVVVPNA